MKALCREQKVLKYSTRLYFGSANHEPIVWAPAPQDVEELGRLFETEAAYSL